MHTETETGRRREREREKIYIYKRIIISIIAIMKRETDLRTIETDAERKLGD